MAQTKSMTSGNPLKLILELGTPLLAGSILQQLYNFVDTVVVGRGIGMDALAAVGLTGGINFLVLGFVMGMAQGVTILVSQYFGAKDYVHLRKAVTMSVFVTYLTGALVTVLAMAGAMWILEVMNTPEEIIMDSWKYLEVIMGGILISLSYNFLSGILRALGDSKNPLIAMVIAFILNTILDILFVIPLNMGVVGAALATVMAQAVSALYCFWCCCKLEILRLHKADWAWSGKMVWSSFSLSLPVAVMNSITAVGVLIMQTAINGFGQVYIAGYSTASKIIILMEQISSTYGFASGTYVGQNKGARQPERIMQGVRQIQFAVIGMNLACAAVSFLLGKQLLGMMIGQADPAVIDTAYHSLVFLSLFLVFLGLLWIYRCALQSMSDTLFPMISGIIEFAARALSIVFLPAILGFDGVLWAEASAWISAAAMLACVYYYRVKKLKKEAVSV